MRVPTVTVRLVTVLALAVASGCSTVAAGPNTPSTPSTTPSSSSIAPATTSASAPSSGATSVDPGSLTSANLPQPTAIGSDWSVTTANGKTSWLTPRDPVETNTGLVPIGCSGLKAIPAFPVARHVLQGQYTDGALNAVVLVMEYNSTATAQRLMSVYIAAISNCPAPTKVTATTPYTRAITVTKATDALIRNSWVEFGVGAGATTWHEVLVRNGNRVGLADVESRPGATPDMAKVEATLRGVIGG
jgi:hypothetical protein